MTYQNIWIASDMPPSDLPPCSLTGFYIAYCTAVPRKSAQTCAVPVALAGPVVGGDLFCIHLYTCTIILILSGSIIGGFSGVRPIHTSTYIDRAVTGMFLTFYDIEARTTKVSNLLTWLGTIVAPRALD